MATGAQQLNCPICQKDIKAPRKMAIAYLMTDEADVMHWKCFVKTFSNTHEMRYIGVVQKSTIVNVAQHWSELSVKDQRSAKTLWTKVKMYGDMSELKRQSDVPLHTLMADRKQEWNDTEQQIRMNSD